MIIGETLNMTEEISTTIYKIEVKISITADLNNLMTALNIKTQTHILIPAIAY